MKPALVSGHADVYIGDALDVLREIPDATVQMCVTSPPYWGLRNYETDGQIGLETTIADYLDRIVAVFEEVRRVLTPTGTLWLNIGDSYATNVRGSGGDWRSTSGIRNPERQEAVNGHRNHGRGWRPWRTAGLKNKDLVLMPQRVAFALQDAGWYIRQDIIWHKLNPMPESTTDRPTSSHEHIWLMSKSERYYYDGVAIAEEVSPNTHRRLAQDVANQRGSARANGGTRSDRPMHPVLMPQPEPDDTLTGYETMLPLPGVNPKALAHGGRVPSGWDTGAGNHHGNRGRYPGIGAKHAAARKDAGAQGERRRTTESGSMVPRVAEERVRNEASERMGREAGWRVKQNPSFAAATGDLTLIRNSRSVWSFATEPYRDSHYATFPSELPRRCILAGSREQDIVLDPFVGTGTTLAAANALWRRSIGIDIDPRNLARIRRRLSKSPARKQEELAL